MNRSERRLVAHGVSYLRRAERYHRDATQRLSVAIAAASEGPAREKLIALRDYMVTYHRENPDSPSEPMPEGVDVQDLIAWAATGAPGYGS